MNRSAVTLISDDTDAGNCASIKSSMISNKKKTKNMNRSIFKGRIRDAYRSYLSQVTNGVRLRYITYVSNFLDMLWPDYLLTTSLTPVSDTPNTMAWASQFISLTPEFPLSNRLLPSVFLLLNALPRAALIWQTFDDRDWLWMVWNNWHLDCGCESLWPLS